LANDKGKTPDNDSNKNNSDPLGTKRSNPFRSNKTDKYDFISVDVKGVSKDVEKIFSVAKSELSSYNKVYNKTIDNMISYTEKSYDSMYSRLRSKHNSYMSDIYGSQKTNAAKMDDLFGKPVKKQIIIDSQGTVKNLDAVAPSNKEPTDKESKGLVQHGAELIVGTLEKYLDIWIDRFLNGVNKIAGTYEATYKGVSVMMNENQSQYMGWQTSAMGEIKNMGLTNNVAISAVMSELSDITKMGVIGERAKNKALADTISKTLSPYISTTTDAYTDLQFKLGDNFTTSMRGMGASIQEQTGQLRFLVKNADDILTNMEPMFLNAKSDSFDKQFSQMAGTLEQMVASGDITSVQAEQYKQDTYSLVMDQYGTLQNGTTAQITALNDMYNKGVNPEDDIAKTLATYGKTSADLMNLADTSGVFGGVNRSAVGTNLVGGSSQMWYTPEESSTWIEALNKMSEIDPNASGEQLLKQLEDDKYTTALEAKDTWTENQSLATAQFKQTYPDAYTLLEGMALSLKAIVFATAASGITNLFSGSGSSAVGKMFGNGTGKIISESTALGAKEAIKTTGSKFLTSATSILSTNAAKIVGGAGGALALGLDAYQGYKKADEWKTSQTASAVGGALGGSGKGLGEGGLIEVGGNIALNALKGAAIGTIFGPVGTLVGAGVGGLFGAIGGKRFAEGMDTVTDTLGKFGKQISGSTNAFSETMGKLEDQFKNQTEIMKDEHNTNVTQMEDLKKTWESATTLEEKRKILVDKGIMTNEEASNSTSAKLESMFENYYKDSTTQEEVRTTAEKEYYKERQKATEDQFNADLDKNKQILKDQLKSKTGDELKAFGEDIGLNEQQIKNIQNSKGKFNEENLINAIINNTSKVGEGATDTENSKILNKKYNLSLNGLDPEQAAVDNAAYATKMAEEKAKTATAEATKAPTKTVNFGMGNILGYAVGDDLVSKDSIVKVHQDEGILTKDDNREYRKVQQAVPVISDFINKASSLTATNNTDNTSNQTIDLDNTDVIKALYDIANNIVTAVKGISVGKDTTATNNLLSKGGTSSYDFNLTNLVPSMPTNR